MAAPLVVVEMAEAISIPGQTLALVLLVPPVQFLKRRVLLVPNVMVVA